LEPTLVVIGLNYRSSPVAVRERFWISEDRRYEALHQLHQAEGIEEVVVLATCNRTEFVLWTSDFATAATSVLNFLTKHYGLRLCEWKHFYRLMDEAALLHVFRVTSSLDSMVVGEPEIVGQVKGAWTKAQQAGTTGRFLDAVFQKALTVSKRVRNETAVGSAAVSVPYAAVELAKQLFGSLDGRKVLVMGAGKMSELSARYLVNSGAAEVRVINRTFEHAAEVAEKLGGIPGRFEDRWQYLVGADIVLSSTGCPHLVLTREDAERIAKEREGRPLFLIDIAVPRDIDPEVRQVAGVFLYDIDDLDQVISKNIKERNAAAAEAEKIVHSEAHQFKQKLAAERVVPTIVALRNRLEQICQDELERYRKDFGPVATPEEQAMKVLTVRIVHRLSGSLARELKLPSSVEQDQLTSAVQRLFHLEESETEQPRTAVAG